MAATIVFIVPIPEPSPVDKALIEEFEALILRLDLHYMRPAEWHRFKGILALATLQAGDAAAGEHAYDLALAKWKTCRWYDGSD